MHDAGSIPDQRLPGPGRNPEETGAVIDSNMQTQKLIAHRQVQQTAAHFPFRPLEQNGFRMFVLHIIMTGCRRPAPAVPHFIKNIEIDPAMSADIEVCFSDLLHSELPFRAKRC